MKKNTLITVAAMVVLGGLATYFFWPYNAPEPALEPAPVPVLAPPPLPGPEVRQIVEAPPPAPPLPTLTDSDPLMLDALAGLVGNQSLIKIFHGERLIRHIVATLDNLPRSKAPMSVMPVERAAGRFVTVGTEGSLAISPENAARYTPYMKIAEVIEAKKLVEAYVRLYPLFQQAYEELGYPGKYFNDRLIVVLDDLLAAPDIKEPIRLVRPKVFYLFADPDLEGRSIGQRILMRTGSRNEAVIKAKLRAIKQELLLRMHKQRVGSAR